MLPPYPAIGLTWTAMANNATSVNMGTSKAIHLLINSITLVNISKMNTGKTVPVPMLPGILPPQQIMIWPKTNTLMVMLSKVSMKDHPHREQIVNLTKEIHAGEPKHLQQGKNARDYLMQAKAMFESVGSTHLSAAPPSHPQANPGIMGNTKTKVSFAQMVKEGKQQGTPVFLPKLGPMNIPVTPRPKEDWQTIQRKRPCDKVQRVLWFQE